MQIEQEPGNQLNKSIKLVNISFVRWIHSVVFFPPFLSRRFSFFLLSLFFYHIVCIVHIQTTYLSLLKYKRYGRFVYANTIKRICNRNRNVTVDC